MERQLTPESQETKNKLFDPVWGSCEFGSRFGDDLLARILEHDAAKRLKDIEQLTFTERFAIRPNTYEFSRYEHVVGSMVLVRKLWEQAAEQCPDDFCDERELLVLQLRTLLSDFGHTFGSHVGDMVFAGFDGKEDFHDETLKTYLRRVGIADLLTQYDVTLDEVVFPDVQDWVECDSPALCVDRVDYAVREIRRWVADSDRDFVENPTQWFELAKNENGYQLVVNDIEFASKFARAYSVIAREHWGNPAQMLQLKLYVDLIRHSLAAQAHHPHPHDVMYGTEQTMHDLIDRQLQRGDKYVHSIVQLMERNAEREREAWQLVKPEFIAFVNGVRDDWPEQSHAFAATPRLDLSTNADSELVKMDMPLAKARRIDPVVRTDDGYGQTSHVDKWLDTFCRTSQPLRILTIAVDKALPEPQSSSRWEQALLRHKMSDTAVRRAMARLAI